MKIWYLLFAVVSLMIGCDNNITHSEKIEKGNSTIHIVPLGNVDINLLNFVKNWINNFYQIDCVIENEKPLTTVILAASETRYEASKILKKYNSNQNTLLLIEKDIAYNNVNRGVSEWGIFGLGYRPGKTCVISTFRLKKSVNDIKFKERLQKVCLHEVGHNLGLPHCNNDSLCLMNDANGTIAQVDKEKIFFCISCKKQIGMK